MPKRKPVPKRTRGTRISAYPFFLPILVLLGVLFVRPVTVAAAGADGRPLGQLKREALELELQRKPVWRALLHVRDYLGGERSVVDDPRFFLSPRGHVDPEAELLATVEALFGPVETGKDPPAEEDPRGPHPQCRFPARLEWLEEQLGAEAPALPPGTCAERDAALERVAPQRATLVFPAAHINNPGSMFGHTLLRVDSGQESVLLSHAVNYAAEIGGEDNGLVYAFKGLFGFYPGYFSVLPYYEKVNQYGAIEQRDIWEYHLNLNPAEVRRMTLHAWELRGMYSDYFFFDENCSFQLLYLLEAARPRVRLTGNYGPWVTPLATVEDVLSSGLVRETDYRPSLATTLRHTAASLDPEGRRLARTVVHEGADPERVLESGLSRGDQARVLDIAALYEQMRLTQGDTDRKDYQKRYLQILRPRSTLPGMDRVAPSIPEPGRPEEGHSSSRIYTAGGYRTDEWLAEVGFRPAYHGVSDPDIGFDPGAQINFFDTALRLYPERGRVHLQRLDLVNILSLSPRDEFFSPISFKVRGGLRTKPFRRQDDGLVAAVNGGGGWTWGNETLSFYLLGEAELDLSRRYDSNAALGLGGSAGVLAGPAKGWKFWFSGRALPYAFGADHPDLSVKLVQSVRLRRNHSALLRVERSSSSGVYHTELAARWNLYF